MKYFDLNIKKILDNWGVENAVREIVANALDESVITQTKDIEVFKEGDYWVIRDFGRGLKIENFSQNENKEKMKHDKVIGNYGVGLKDAIAVFHKKGISLEIKTKYFIARPVMHVKDGFNEETIHVEIEEHSSSFVGTQFKIGIDDSLMDKAKSLFLFFKEQEPISQSDWGEIYEDRKGEIYLNGLIISENPSFTYSYNILKKSKKLIKNLNRERTNVGKEAFSDIISKIIINSDDESIAKEIELNKEVSEEFKIKMTREFIYRKIYSNVIAVTQGEFETLSDETKEIIKRSGKELKIVLKKDIGFFRESGHFPTLEGFLSDYQDSLVVEELDTKTLNKNQLKNLELVFSIFKILKKYLKLNFKKKDIKVTESVTDLVGMEVLGMWKQGSKTINLSKSVLDNEQQTVETFLHEVAHSINNNADGTRDFESDLGQMIWFAAKHLKI